MTLYHVTLQYRNNAPHEYDVRVDSPQEAVSRIMWEGWTIDKSRLLADHDNKIPNHVLLRLVVTKKARHVWYLRLRHFHTGFMNVIYTREGCLLSEPGREPFALPAPVYGAAGGRRHVGQHGDNGKQHDRLKEDRT